MWPSAAVVRSSRWAQRLKGTPPGRLLHEAVVRRRIARLPKVSVVVPFHDSVTRLDACLRSLLQQTHQNLEIVLVDDGSVDGSADVAAYYARTHRRIVLVRQDQRGVGAARNAGIDASTGTYLAFCDSDDTVVADGYERLVDALETSGSDLAVGSVTLQSKGQHLEPAWARRSNPNRLLGVALEDHPQIMANLITGPRMFRRSFWDRHELRFDTQGDHSDVVTVVRTLLLADRFDVLPAVVYRWWWREDGRSLWQRGLLDKARVADRVGRLCDAGDLVVSSAPEAVQAAFLSEVLHTTVPELVRAAVARSDGYWEALSQQLGRLLILLSPEIFRLVPFEDRVICWLCAHDHRLAAEAFLEYAFDNSSGYPFTLRDGHPFVEPTSLSGVTGLEWLIGLEQLPDAPPELTRVADSEIRMRTRMLALHWARPGVLSLLGGAFLEYLDDRAGPTDVTLVVRQRRGELEVRVPTVPTAEAEVNSWSGRAHEDHAGAGFRAEIDVAQLLPSDGTRAAFDIDVELRIGDRVCRGPFFSRRSTGAAGLLEPSRADTVQALPVWRRFDGLRLQVRAADDAPFPPVEAARPVRVTAARVADGVLTLGIESLAASGAPAIATEVRLRGPRGSSAWTPIPQPGGSSRQQQTAAHEICIELYQDEWGLGRTPMPADTYRLEVRGAAGLLTAGPTLELRRQLPLRLQDGDLEVSLSAPVEGDRLLVRLAPVEWRRSRPPYYRRRLRETLYPEVKQQPLRDAVLFETFAGKAAGDNPGALCRELVARQTGLDLAFSVLDRSIEVPEGARAVIRFSEEYFRLLGQARYLIVNASLPYFFRKREGQLYFQTWHGSPLKRIAHDRPHLDFFNWHHRRQLLIARDGWDFLLSQSDFCTRALSSAFRYSGPVMDLGYPRNDVLQSERAGEIRRETRRNLGIPDDSFVVLYAPTWRDNLRMGRVFDKVLYLDPQRLVSRLDDAVVLVRGHYNSVLAAEKSDPDRRVIDVTRYPDIADLYLVADALVTDYSSVFFDFVLTDKPMVFLAPDLNQYRDDNRGFYLDYESTVPGPICQSTDEVVAALKGPDGYGARRTTFREEFAPYDDGKASARVIDEILKVHPYQ